MDLRKLYLTKNLCYKKNESITPKGVMWHSTGANNPNLRRYVGPDDSKLGVNKNNNHWNTATPGGRKVCAHAFIGKDKTGKIATYQTLPFNINGWHAGGDANKSYIGFEICEDGLKDKTYFEKVYKEAVEFTAYLCKLYKLDPMGKNVIICHADGARLGIASNHADVLHWFKYHNKTMDDVRKDVKAAMSETTKTETAKTDTKKLYRVRKSWKNAKSQLGAFSALANAKAIADKNPGYYVFDNNGKAVYPTSKTASSSFKVGDKVKLSAKATIYGKKSKFASWVYNSVLYVREIDGNRVVISTQKTGAITGAVDKKYLTKI